MRTIYTNSWITSTTWQTTGYGTSGPVGTIGVTIGERTYAYSHVPLWVYGAMHRSKSLGKAYNKHLKGRAFERRSARKAPVRRMTLVEQLQASLEQVAA